MATIAFDLVLFRARFPSFSNITTFPDVILNGYWDVATCYINPEDYGILSGDCREQAIMLMTAHLSALSVIIAGGQTPGIVTSASIDKVSVSMDPPPSKDQFQWWLNLTTYGIQLWFMLSIKSVGGMYIGGSSNYSAFRKPNGRF